MGCVNSPTGVVDKPVEFLGGLARGVDELAGCAGKLLAVRPVDEPAGLAGAPAGFVDKLAGFVGGAIVGGPARGIDESTGCVDSEFVDDPT